MIAAVGTHGEMPMLIIGLAEEDLVQLLAGGLIPLDGAQLGLPAMKVVLAGGRTDADLDARLRREFPDLPPEPQPLGGS